MGKRTDIEIKPQNVGKLRAIAEANGGMKADGRISKTWARAYLKKPGVHKKTKQRIRFFLNLNR